MELETSYTPREGSKASFALEAMVAGPLTYRQLSLAMDIDESNIGTALARAKDHGLVAIVVNEAGVKHYMRADQPLPEGFKIVEGRMRPDINAADPFSLGTPARAGGGQPQAKPQVPKAVDDKPDPVATGNEGGRSGAGAADAALPVRPSVRSAVPQPARSSGIFLAALFSTGELMIQIGDDQVFLNREHQRELRQYCARFEA